MTKRVKTSRSKWPYVCKEGLVHVLLCYKDAKWREHDGNWTAEGWIRIANEFNRKFPDYHSDVAEVKSQARDLKIKYKLIRDIRKRSDMFWHEGWIVLDDDVWDELVKADPRVRKVRDKSFPYYDLLVPLFEGHEASLEDGAEEEDYEDWDYDAEEEDGVVWEDTEDDDDTEDNDVTAGAEKVARSKWPYVCTEGLVHVLLSYKDARWREHDGNWTAEGMNIVTKEFNGKFPDYYSDVTEIKSRIRNLRIVYELIRDIRKRSDALWDHDLCWILLDDDVWDELIKADPRVRKVKDKGFPYYDLLVSLFEGHKASLPKPPAERKHREGRMTDARTTQDDFSVTRCVEILNGMEELTKDEMVVGCDVFFEANNRESFIALRPDLRIPWIRRKIAGLT